MSVDKRESYSLFTERFRPNTIKEMILPKTVKSFFIKIISEKDIPNMLFHSTNPGSGKTSVAQCIANDLGCDFLHINASLESGIDTIREKVIGFSSCSSFNDTGKKLILLDEIDGFSQAAQKSIRGVIEECHNYCRFILTCNSISQIIDPIVSRCQCIDFNFSEQSIKEEMIPKYIKRVEYILKVKKIEYDPEVAPKLVDKYFPDLRKIINVIQQYSVQNNIVDSSILSFETISDELIELVLTKKFTKAREFIVNSNYNYSDLYTMFFHQLVPKLTAEKRPEITILLAQYSYQSSMCQDKELQLSSCLYEIMGAI